ncbi:MAG: ATP-binding protein [Candidatus Dadabacteria bacterium]|nr:MAG: ATP-binding protein [Candidatus Dadabacteria bacterium]
MKQIVTMAINIPREEISDAAGHLIAAFEVFKAGQFEEALLLIHEKSRSIFSLEIYTHKQQTQLCFTTDTKTAAIISAAIYTMIPTATIEEVNDLTSAFHSNNVIVAGEVRPLHSDVVPFQTYRELVADPCAPLLNILSLLPSNHKVLIQHVCQAAPDNWLLHFKLKLQHARHIAEHPFRPMFWFKPGYLKSFFEYSPRKVKQKQFKVNIRIAVAAPIEDNGVTDKTKQLLQNQLTEELISILAGLQFLNWSDFNKFVLKRIKSGYAALQPLTARNLKRPFYLSAQELGSLWHPVYLNLNCNLAQVIAATGSPPANLPSDRRSKDVSIFAITDYRNTREIFGIKRTDRKKHLHIMGKSGSGKSKLLQLLAETDMRHGFGLAVVDCHGDLVEELLMLVPEERIDDVILFDPTDLQFPFAFNPFAGVPEALHDQLTSEFLRMFEVFSESNWTESVERVVHNAIMAMLKTKNASIMTLFNFLSESGARRSVIEDLPTGPLRSYWDKPDEELDTLLNQPELYSLINVLGGLLSTNIMSNILASPKSKIDFHDVLDNNRILLIKIPKRSLGKANSVLLGTMFLSLLKVISTERHSAQRDFYIYVDEFQNFATESFSKSLEPAQKYGISYTIAHQMLSQIPNSVANTLTSTIQNIIVFQLGGEDASSVEKRFEPVFEKADIINLPVRHFYIRMSIDGNLQEPFSGRTLDVVYPQKHFAAECTEKSRSRYCKDC